VGGGQKGYEIEAEETGGVSFHVLVEELEKVAHSVGGLGVVVVLDHLLDELDLSAASTMPQLREQKELEALPQFAMSITREGDTGGCRGDRR
jgi:hypothetical protein